MAMRDSLDVLGGKWKLMILRFLTNRTHQVIHFKKMQREIDGISAKMLSKELKELETNLLITRTEQDTKPATVVYAITEYGKSVLPVTETLVNWGLAHREKIIESIK
ncbi:putative HTH-type transcriptional regulator YtcD [compost metagenome]